MVNCYTPQRCAKMGQATLGAVRRNHRQNHGMRHFCWIHHFCGPFSQTAIVHLSHGAGESGPHSSCQCSFDRILKAVGMEGDIQKSDHILPGCGKEKNSDFTLKNLDLTNKKEPNKSVVSGCPPVDWLVFFVTLSSDWFVRSISFP